MGMVMVLRSFIGAQAALDTGRNRILAMQMLEAKIAELEEQAKEEEGISVGASEEETNIANRTATFKKEIIALEDPEFEIEEVKPGEQPKKNQHEINEVTLTLSWQEGGREKDAVLAAYLKNRKE
jgi:hypothetical protein